LPVIILAILAFDQSMVSKSGYRFSEKIMRQQKLIPPAHWLAHGAAAAITVAAAAPAATHSRGRTFRSW
jgi:hypothetical protein